jgi:hypothetical protein
MFKWGLLLSPEEIVFLGEPYRDEPTGQPIRILQKRFCLTELSEEELSDHAQVFGPIALEFDQPTLRRIGAMPVVYIPQQLSDEPRKDQFALVGQTLVYRMFDTYQLLSDLAGIRDEVSELSSDRVSVTLGHPDSDVTVEYPVALLRHFLETLTYKRQPLRELASAMQLLSCFFYPTDEAIIVNRWGDIDDGRLAYYREREWRIVSGIRFGGKPLDGDLPANAAIEISALIQDSFSPYASAKIEGLPFTNSCSLIQTFGGRSIMDSVRRILAPSDLIGDVATVARKFRFQGVIAEYPGAQTRKDRV